MQDEVLGEWQAGYIGTAEYRRDRAFARAAREGERNTETVARGLAPCDAPAFFGMPAPSGTGEGVTARGTAGGTGETPITPLPVRALLSRYRRAAESRRRKRVMQDARTRETARRAALVDAETPLRVTPLLTQEYGTVSDWAGVDLRTLLALSETGWHAADALLEAFDAAVGRQAARAGGWRALMGHDASNEGRGTTQSYRAADGERTAAGTMVNGTEVRHSERWTQTPRVARLGEDGRTLDWRCYQTLALADGTGTLRRLFTPSRQGDAATSGRRETAAQADARRMNERIAAIVAQADHGATAERLA